MHRAWAGGWLSALTKHRAGSEVALAVTAPLPYCCTESRERASCGVQAVAEGSAGTETSGTFSPLAGVAAGLPSAGGFFPPGRGSLTPSPRRRAGLRRPRAVAATGRGAPPSGEPLTSAAPSSGPRAPRPANPSRGEAGLPFRRRGQGRGAERRREEGRGGEG